MNIISYLFSFPYLRVEILFIFIPTCVIWIWQWWFLINYKKTLIYVTIFSFIWGFIYDFVAGPTLDIWRWNNSPVIWGYFLGIPLEEYLFLLIVPQYYATILLLVKKFYKYGKI